MLKAHASKRKYNFQDMKVNQIRKFDYVDHGKLRHAVFVANRRGEGKFICRVIETKKTVAVQRVE